MNARCNSSSQEEEGAALKLVTTWSGSCCHFGCVQSAADTQTPPGFTEVCAPEHSEVRALGEEEKQGPREALASSLSSSRLMFIS